MNMSPKVNSSKLVFLRGSYFKMLQLRPIQMKHEIQLEREFLLARSTAIGERVKRFEIVLVAKRNPKFIGANGDGANGADGAINRHCTLASMVIATSHHWPYITNKFRHLNTNSTVNNQWRLPLSPDGTRQWHGNSKLLYSLTLTENLWKM